MRDRSKVASGKVLQKSKKLFPITTMQLTTAAGNVESSSSWNADEHAAEVKHEYENKWGVHNLHLRQKIADILAGLDGRGMKVTLEDVSYARDNIRKVARVDHYGVSPLGIIMLAFVRPESVCSFISRVMSSQSLMESISIRGQLYAKARGAILASKTRAILPLPGILTIIDCILFNYWQPIVDGLFLPSAPFLLERGRTPNVLT